MTTSNTYLMGESDFALKKHACESKLPKIDLKKFEEKGYQPSELLMDILHFARPAEGRGEYLFRQDYLHPIFDVAEKVLEDTSWETDAMGNMVVFVGKNFTQAMHVGHIDTVHDDEIAPYQDVEVSEKGIVTLAPVLRNSTPKINKGARYIDDVKRDHHYVTYELPPKQQRCLGADDGCAVACMLYLIMHGIEGTYVFTRGEEVGCVGAKYLLSNSINPILDFSQYNLAIEVDRKGTDEIISQMSPGTTASTQFVTSLATQLDMGHKLSTRGSITDVGHFARVIPECVNIAAGYNLQHSDRENTDLVYFDKLCENMLTIDYAALVINRKAGAYAVQPVSTQRRTSRQFDSLGYDDTGDYQLGGNYARSTPCNMYGDFDSEPAGDKRTVGEVVAKYPGDWQARAWVQRNAGFILAFLQELDISLDEMDKICQEGLSHLIETKEEK